ncbi:glycosyltransferase [Flavobacteriaceae bacterium AU392]|nr:glycosyltransferase family 2 protein [Flavobacteriaceae bacterium]RKM81107.1 glycosyltransferase [Flavobacteriaceae bacterium AU392]
MELSVVILNYNVRYFLELCIKSVQAAIADIDAEIIVIDNNSSDKSCEMIMQLFPEVHLIKNTENLGFSKANNLAVKKAKGKYVCILNPDTVVTENTFKTLLEFANSKNNLGVVGCKLIDGSGKLLPESKRNIPYVSAAVFKLLGNTKRYYASHLSENRVGKVDVLVGAFMLMKRKLYDELGGFDEDYFMYGEDIDLSYRVLKSGKDNYYYGEETIIHYKGESTLKDKNYAKQFFGAMQIFYKKHFKKNLIFDSLVWLGIRLAYLMREEQESKDQTISKYYFVSDRQNKKLEDKLDKKLILQSKLNSFEDNTEIIFDANYLKYQQIVEKILEISEIDKAITYKILPNNSNFIIGSDQKFSQGTKIIFE